MSKRFKKMFAFFCCLVLMTSLIPSTFATDIVNNDNTAANVTPTAMFGTPQLGSNDPLWNQTMEHLINKSTVPDDTRPHATGTAKILWDNDYLYARVVVEDSNLYQGSGGDHTYDSLEFYVGSGSNGSNQWRISSTGVFSGQAATGRAAWTQITDTGYIVEMRIPKRTLTLQQGKFTFDIYINNSTQNGADRYEVVSAFGEPDKGYSSSATFTDSIDLIAATENDNRHSITISNDTGGIITPNAPGNVLRVASGSDHTFTVTPNYGKVVDTVTVDGQPVTLSDGNYTLTGINANHAIHATFKDDPDAAQLPFIVWNDNFASGEYTTAVIIDLGEGNEALGSELNPGLFTVSARNTTLNGSSLVYEGTRKISRVYANNEPKVRGYLGKLHNSPDYQPGLPSGRYVVVELEFYTEVGGNTTLDGSSNSTLQNYNIVQNGNIVLTEGTPLSYVVFKQENVVNPILDKFTTPTGNSVNRALYLHKDEDGDVVQGLPLYVYTHGMSRGGTSSATDQKASMKSANGSVALMKKIEENPEKYASHILNISYNGTSTPTTANVKKVIDDIVATGAVDPNRIYAAGFSWGGQYTNTLVNAYPGFFAAAAPMAPVSGSPNASSNDAHANIAYWMFINKHNAGTYQTNLTNYINNNMPKMTNARASNFESNEALTWPYNQYDQPSQRPNPANIPALQDYIAHEVEAAVLYNQITMDNSFTGNTWSIAPIAQSSNLPVWNNDYANVFEWMFAQTKQELPSAPLNFKAKTDEGQVTLSWTKPANSGASALSGYKVWYGDETPITLNATTTEYVFTGLTNHQSYTFNVVAVNSEGDGVKVTVTATPKKTLSAMFGTPQLGSNDPLWNKTMEHLINKSTVPNDARPHATGTARVLWDNDYIYARVVVEDSNLYQGAGGDHTYDSLEFYVGPGSSGSNQWRVSATGVFSGQADTGRTAWTEITDTGYIVEMRIPKRTLSLQPGNFTFEVYINNSTENGADRYEVVSAFGTPDTGFSSHNAFANSLELIEADEVDTRFTINATTGPGGKITPNAPGNVLKVAPGTSKTFTLIPDHGKIADTVTVNGDVVTLANDNTFTLTNINAHQNIHVTFKDDPTADKLSFIVWNDNFASGEYTTAVIIDLGEGKEALASELNKDLFTVSAKNTILVGDSVVFEGTHKISRVYANNEPKVRGYLGKISNSPDYQSGLERGRYIVVELEFYTEVGGKTTLDGSNSTKQNYNIVQNDDIVLTEGAPLSYVVFEQDNVVNPILDKFTSLTSDSVNYALYLHKDEDGEALQGMPLYVYTHGFSRGGTQAHIDQKASMKSANGSVALMKKMEENPEKYASHILNISYSGGSTPQIADVKKIIDNMVADGLVDSNRIYASGFSMGAMYTNTLINTYPGFFAAGAPLGIASGAPSVSANEIHKDQAYWIFVNQYDARVNASLLDNFIDNDISDMTNARASRFNSNEALSWPYNQYDQPSQRPNLSNTPPMPDYIAHEVEAAVLYNKITMTNPLSGNTWSIAPIAQSPNLPAWDDQYSDVFDWMFVQSKQDVPSAPIGVKATAGNGQVTLNWAAPIISGKNEVSGYKVWYGDNTPVTLNATTTQHTFTGLTNGQVYTFTIVAVNELGDGAETSVTATPTQTTAPDPGPGSNTNPNPPSSNPNYSLNTPKDKPAVTDKDGNTTLPGGGEITTKTGMQITVPEGTTIDANGKINIPANKNAELKGNSTVILSGGSTIQSDGTIVVGQDGASVTLNNGLALSLLAGTKLTFNDDMPLGFIVTSGNPFNDVNANNWFNSYVNFAYTSSLFNGTSSTTFEPNAPMTRAMFVQVLANLAKVNSSDSTTSRFSDVKDGQWYTAAIEWAANSGIVNGVNADEFDPNASITREQMLVILHNFMKNKNYKVADNNTAPSFSDESEISSWALDAVKIMQSMGIVSGREDNRFDSKAIATRAEVATIFVRFIEYLAKQ